MSSFAVQLTLDGADAIATNGNKDLVWFVKFDEILGDRCVVGKKFNLVLNGYATDLIANSPTQKVATFWITSSAMDFNFYRCRFNNNLAFGRQQGVEFPYWYSSGTNKAHNYRFNFSNVCSFRLLSKQDFIQIRYLVPSLRFPGIHPEFNSSFSLNTIFYFTIFEVKSTPIRIPYTLKPKQTFWVYTPDANVNVSNYNADVTFWNIDFAQIIRNPVLGKKYNLFIKSVMALGSGTPAGELRFTCSAFRFNCGTSKKNSQKRNYAVVVQPLVVNPDNNFNIDYWPQTFTLENFRGTLNITNYRPNVVDTVTAAAMTRNFYLFSIEEA